MPLTLAEFVHRWKVYRGSERAGAQPHFLDLCDMLGQAHPAAADSAGERYAFEKHTSRSSGGKGFADVWLRDHFAWEYKGDCKDLARAYKQLNDYREELGNPPLLVVSDFEHFQVHTNFTATKKRIYKFDLDDLNRNQVTATCPLPPLEVLRALFGDTDRLRPERTDAQVTQDVAKQFARLAERLELEERSLGATREQIAHFLMRVLFCLFADSIGLLPDGVFRKLLQSEDRFQPRRFLRKLTLLFEAMSQEDGIFGEHTIRWFNGGLFNDDRVIQLDKTDLGILYEVSRNYDWSHIAPAIFGTLFERSLDPARRSLIGAHYTSAEDILLLIEPVVMRPLEQRWAAVRAEILVALQQERAEEAARSARQPLLRVDRPSQVLLAAWIGELTAVRVLDPACGSGNFLYVALRRLLDLWLEAQRFAAAEGISLVLPNMVSPSQCRPRSSTALRPSSTHTNSPPSSSGSAFSSGSMSTASMKTASPSSRSSRTSCTPTPSCATTKQAGPTNPSGLPPTTSSATPHFWATSGCARNSIPLTIPHTSTISACCTTAAYPVGLTSSPTGSREAGST